MNTETFSKKMHTSKELLYSEPKTLPEVIANLFWHWGYTQEFNEDIAEVVYGFTDWYHNGLSNVERGTPEEMFPKYLELMREIG